MLFFAVIVLVGLALLPLWGSRDVSLSRWRIALTLLGLAAIGAATVWTPPRTDVLQRPLEVLAAGYAGSATCRSCHPAEHASWHGSFHRTMTQIATRDSLQASFERLELDWFGSPVVLEWRGDQLWTKFARGGRQPAAVERPIEQITGSHHLQVLWYTTGEQRQLAPVPMCFKLEERVWIPLTSVFVLPPEFRDPVEPGAWNHSCAMCHATDTRPRVDTIPEPRTDTHVGEFGISCEACHGPGARHVAANRNPLRRYMQRAAGEDDTIANPDTLLPARSAEACGQCHSVSILRRKHFDDWRDHGSPFLPGQDLQSSHLVIDLGDRAAPELREASAKNPNFFRSRFWADGEVRLSGREFSGLRQSPCYTHGDRDRQIDCTSCHQLHTGNGAVDDDWRDDQLREGMRGNRACTQCHESLHDDGALAAHTRHDAKSVGSNCMNCHMPHTSIGLMKASRSHAITSPDVATELRTSRPNACNLCHLDQTLQWTAEQLRDGWGRAMPALDAEQRGVAAGARWILTGDAGIRMLAAWSFGWSAAQAAAGRDWLAPYLGRLLDDPYYVVRFNAARSLRTVAPFENVVARYDFLGEPQQATVFVDNVTDLWQSRYRGGARPAVLLDERGLMSEAFAKLYARRDDRPVYLAE